MSNSFEIDSDSDRQKSTERRIPLPLILGGIGGALVVFIVFWLLSGMLQRITIPSDWSVSAERAEIGVGEITQVWFESKDALLNDVEDGVVWESSNSAVAQVDTSGTVTGVSDGEATITGTYHDQSDSITICVVSSEAELNIIAERSEILVGESAMLVLQTADGPVGDGEVQWSSSQESVASVGSNGFVRGHSEGSVVITASYQSKSATTEITVIQPETAKGLGAVPLKTIQIMPDSIACGSWFTEKAVQGIEWNTDTMEKFYVCFNSYIVPYKVDGTPLKQKDAKTAQFTSLDYYDGKLYTVMRSRNDGKFKLRVYDADSLELKNSTDLVDIHKQYSSDKDKFGKNIVPCIDGITVAPALGSGGKEKLYISYNAYYSESDTLALHSRQQIYEYDLKKAKKQKDKVEAERVFSVDLGSIERGIQTLEYDRATGMIWCAVQQGFSNYSLFCLDSNSMGNSISLVYNNSREGWDCPQAADGLCSVGNDWYYVLIPSYNGDTVSAEIRKVNRDGLESIAD